MTVFHFIVAARMERETARADQAAVPVTCILESIEPVELHGFYLEISSLRVSPSPALV